MFFDVVFQEVRCNHPPDITIPRVVKFARGKSTPGHWATGPLGHWVVASYGPNRSFPPELVMKNPKALLNARRRRQRLWPLQRNHFNFWLYRRNFPWKFIDWKTLFRSKHQAGCPLQVSENKTQSVIIVDSNEISIRCHFYSPMLHSWFHHHPSTRG